jgi:hypothetical protein
LWDLRIQNRKGNERQEIADSTANALLPPSNTDRQPNTSSVKSDQ